MEDILDSIANITSLIEDAINDMEWELVKDAKQELDELYEELDKKSYKYEQYD
jgi:Mg2+ and Co2+ transporter CorA